MNLTKVTFHNAGHCWQLGYFAGAASWGVRRFYAVVVRFEHPVHGVCLIDTGYSPQYFVATQSFPERLFRWLLPVASMRDESPRQRWRKRGIDRDEIDHLFVSHFHGDHIGAVFDFPDTRTHCREELLRELLSLSRWKQINAGFFAGLLPDDFAARCENIGEASFTTSPEIDLPFASCDFWGDGSLLLVDLPGHSHGHTGYVLRADNRTIFYVVDACWDVSAMLSGRHPPLPGRMIQHHAAAYIETQKKLQAFAETSNWEIVACHCPLTQQRDDFVENG